MHQPKDDLSRSLVTLDQDRTLIGVVELSLKTWLVGGIVPGIGREPLKKLVPDEDGLFRLLHRWRDEATRAGHTIKRIVVAFEAGRDGFWLARWLRARGVEAYVIHPTSIPVSREQRRAKTDRLDIGLLKRSFIGWLRGERKHCTMIAIPTLDDEDAKRPNREREQLVGKRTRIINRMKATMMRLGIRGFNPKLRNASGRLASLRTPEGRPIPPNTLAELQHEMAHLRFINLHIKQIEGVRQEQLKNPSRAGSNSKVLQLTRVRGVGIETADMLANEAFSRDLRDQRAVARYAGLTGSPDESGSRRREKGLAKGRECTRSSWHDPASMAVPGTSEGQRSGSMVPSKHRRRQEADYDDRGVGLQAAHCTVAIRRDR